MVSLQGQGQTLAMNHSPADIPTICQEEFMTKLLEIKDLRVAVDEQELLHEVNLVVPDGEVHTLLGPNGSGKTWKNGKLFR